MQLRFPWKGSDQMAHTLARWATLEVVPNRTARRAIAVVAFTVLTALGAHLAIPLPGNPVPVTMQTLFVTLSGALLGPYLGASSQLLYLLAGISGLPMFALTPGPAALIGPTGGYLLSFPIAAALVGVLAGGRASGFVRIAFAMLIASAVILALGAAQLALITGDAQHAVQLGVLPFVIGDSLKVALGALIAQRLRSRTLGLF
jgi:biotin transport system substrate-specific component